MLTKAFQITENIKRVQQSWYRRWKPPAGFKGDNKQQPQAVTQQKKTKRAAP